ncbi:MAG TPA: NAD(P)H-dependent oxidoreductase [Candidatus Omnitrophota bacterium]|nr:NAD(P)H-dependent oxidoreductase [Candidatus Omnitrophota bacterium]
MKHLIVYSHPNPASFNHAIQETLVRVLKEKGHHVRVRDLYALRFDPVLRGDELKLLQENQSVSRDTAIEQEHVRWADQITFIYPVWWGRMPAMTCGYFDRVFSKGFAYDYGPEGLQKLLPGKKVCAISTMGAPLSAYEDSGMMKSMKQTIDEESFQFCGMVLIEHKYFGAVPTVTDEERKKMLGEVASMASAWPV